MKIQNSTPLAMLSDFSLAEKARLGFRLIFLSKFTTATTQTLSNQLGLC